MNRNVPIQYNANSARIGEQVSDILDGKAPHRRRVQLADALGRLGASRFAKMLVHGSLDVELYAPRGSDPQQPHTRDEVYIIVRGEGMFVNGDVRHPFETGDVMFVPAGEVHRFEDFSEDLVTWVIFWGPEGGE